MDDLELKRHLAAIHASIESLHVRLCALETRESFDSKDQGRE